MKNFLLYCAILLTCVACEKDELTTIPIEKSFGDPSLTLADFKTKLLAGADGWEATLAPKEGRLFGGYLKFEANGEATMVMDYSGSAAQVPFKNKYSLEVTQAINPTLSIDKTSPFGIFAATANLDTDYTFQSSSGDTIKLLGNTFGSALTLVKATAQEGADYLAGKIIQSAVAVNTLNTFNLYFKRLTIGGKSYDLIISPQTGVVTFNYMDNGVFKRFHTYYAHTENGITFKTPFVEGANRITGLSNFQVSKPSNTATVSAGGTTATITNVATPIGIDLQAAQNFYNLPANGSNWETYDGFTVEGAYDYYKLNTIPGFNGITYWPRRQVAGTTVYDGFLLWTAAGTNHGPAMFTQVTADGKLKFVYSGLGFSLATMPAAAVPIMTASRNQLAIPEGYFPVQTSPITYDLVSAKDGKAWISFF